MKKLIIVFLITGALAACGDNQTNQDGINNDADSINNNMQSDTSRMNTDTTGTGNMNQDTMRR